MVVRLHQLRTADFRRGRRLGRGDHAVGWPEPARPGWIGSATYEALPATLEVREVEVRVTQPGFRTKRLVVVTTLRGAAAFPARGLATLYRARWQITFG